MHTQPRSTTLFASVDEQRLTTEQQGELWKAWVARGPQGPIDDGADTEAILQRHRDSGVLVDQTR